MKSLNEWKRQGVRGIGPGIHKPGAHWYIRITPNFGIALPWFGGRRIRFAFHHGVQIVAWRSGYDDNGVPWGRWFVVKQLFGVSKVKGERYLTEG